MKKTYEGLQENIRSLKTPRIDAWRNKYADKDYEITIQTDEFTCICPKTGLPDFGTIEINYSPDKLCVELKSFKLYLVSFRNAGVFHEHVTNRLLDDFVEACRPRSARISVGFRSRGGIVTTVTREYKK